MIIKLRIEFWWLMERWAQKVWEKFCPEDKASYWLDWLTAFTYGKRKDAEFDQYKRKNVSK